MNNPSNQPYDTYAEIFEALDENAVLLKRLQRDVECEDMPYPQILSILDDVTTADSDILRLLEIRMDELDAQQRIGNVSSN